MLSSTKGIFWPKNRIKNMIPKNSIISKKSGMYTYVAIAGMVNVVITNMRHIAATKAIDRIIGMAD